MSWKLRTKNIVDTFPNWKNVVWVGNEPFKVCSLVHCLCEMAVEMPQKMYECALYWGVDVKLWVSVNVCWCRVHLPCNKTDPYFQYWPCCSSFMSSPAHSQCCLHYSMLQVADIHQSTFALWLSKHQYSKVQDHISKYFSWHFLQVLYVGSNLHKMITLHWEKKWCIKQKGNPTLLKMASGFIRMCLHTSTQLQSGTSLRERGSSAVHDIQ